MGRKLIALDAGHGINTAGRRCLAAFDPNQTREWQLNSRIVEKLTVLLQEYDCDVLRIDDPTGATDPSTTARAKKSNATGADVFVSVHHNAGIKGGKGGGTTLIHYCDSERGIAMAQSLYDSVVIHTGLRGNRSKKVVKKASSAVLTKTDTYAYLVENGFMDSSVDTPIIITEGHAERTAEGILEWLVEEFALQPAKVDSGATEQPAAPAEDGSYTKWPAVCNEPNTNVRTGPGTTNGIYTPWPKLGRGNQVDVIGEGIAANGRKWYKILIANAHEAWVYGAYLDPA